VLILAASCKKDEIVNTREVIILDGSWRFGLDTAGVGIAEKWYS